MCYKSWFDNDIRFINSIIQGDGNIYTFNELKAIYNININFLQYSRLERSIFDWQKNLSLANIINNVVNPIIRFSIQISLKN